MIKNLIRMTALIALFATATGCGNFRNASARKTQTSTFDVGDSATIGPNVSPSNLPSISGATVQVPTGTQALFSFRVGTTGYNSTSVAVPARTVLKVRFTPGTQDELVAGTGFSPQYSGLGVYISVGAEVQPTPLLHNGYAGTPVESQTLDLSSGIQSSCGSDTTCRQTVTITISKPNYDWYCLNNYGGCPWAWVYSTHPWHGTLEVETDDTVAFPSASNSR